MDPGSYAPIIFRLHSWGSLLGIPIKVPLKLRTHGFSNEAHGLGSRVWDLWG